MKLTHALLPLLILSAPAFATLDSQVGKDEAGNTTLTVQNKAQAGMPPAQLGISPAKVEGQIAMRAPRLDKSVTFYNYTNKPKQIKLTLVDKEGSASLKDWTLINPKNITIAPNGQQTIRLSFRPPKSATAQSYEAILFIEQQVKDPLLYDEDGKGVTMQIGSRYGLPIRLQTVVK